MVSYLQEDRPVFKKQNSHNAKDLLVQETAELVDAIETKPEEIAQELADVLYYCLLIAEQNGVDAESAFREKLASTLIKYPAKDFQDGEYAVKHAKAREDWANGGKQAFYDIDID